MKCFSKLNMAQTSLAQKITHTHPNVWCQNVSNRNKAICKERKNISFMRPERIVINQINIL